MAKQRKQPSRPLLEVSPVLHAQVKQAAAKAGMPIKELTAALLANGLLRIAAGTLQVHATQVVVDDTDTEGRAES